MRKIKQILSVAILSSLLASCTITYPIAVSEEPIGSKKGESSSIVLFRSIFLNGSYGINDACKNGKIKGAVSTVDEKVSSYVFFRKYTMQVTGE